MIRRRRPTGLEETSTYTGKTLANTSRLATSLCVLYAAAVLPTTSLAQGLGQRTVIDTERATLFSDPNGFSLSDLGARVGIHRDAEFSKMSQRSIKVTHGRFHITRPNDETGWS